MEQHFKVVAVLQIVMGCLSLSLAFVIFSIVAGVGVVATAASGNRLPLLIGGGVGLIAGTILVVLALPSIVAGIGLLRRREWARILTIVLSILHLLHVPLGTIVGVYSLWALFQPDANSYFN